MEQRKYDRVCVEYSASFSGESYRAKGTILNLSIVGCRARTAFVIKKGECLGVLIDVPRYDHPLYVARAEVRWSDGQEFGMEFIYMELEDRHRLCEVIRAIEAAPERRTEHGDEVTQP
jgi:PilZ domain-containing protein